MAATYSKPAKTARWADSGTIVEPAEGKKDTGWIFEEVPPFSWENWYKNLNGQWLKWIDERFFDGGTEDDFLIYHPGEGDKGIEFLSSSIGIFIPDADISALFEDLKLTLFDDVFIVARSASGDEHQIYLEVEPGSPFPVLAYNLANDRFAIRLDNSAGGAALVDVDTDGQLEIDINGSFFVRTQPGVGVGSGAELNLFNFDATVAARWRLNQGDKVLTLSSYTSVDVLEKSYFNIFHDTTTMRFHDDIVLEPTTDDNGELGTTTKSWEQIHVGYVYEKNYAFCYTKGQADINVVALAEVTAMPETEIRQSTGTFVTTNQLTVAVKGKYLIECAFAMQVGGNQQGDGEIRLYKNGVEETTGKLPFSVRSAAAIVSRNPVTYVAIVDMDTPLTDDIELRVYNANAGGPTIIVLEESQFCATLLNAEA